MSDQSKIEKFAKSLLTLMSVSSPDEVFDTLTNALQEKLQCDGISKDSDVVLKVRRLIERHYRLSSTDLDDCFRKKNRELTEPKFMWVNISISLLGDNRPKVKNLIGNGLTTQKIYACVRQFKKLEDYFVPDEVEKMRSTYKKIIDSYE